MLLPRQPTCRLRLDGLREELALDRVADNLRQGKFQAEATLVHDTTHYHDWSEMKVTDLPEADEARRAAGTVVKSTGKMYWGPKAST